MRRDIDALIKAKGRAPIEMYLGLALFAALVFAIASPERAASFVNTILFR